MNQKERTKVSKFLSLVLRHRPETIHLNLDSQGWAQVDELLEKMHKQGVQITREDLFEVIQTNDKQRFALSEDQGQIRASQGHSIDVQLDYTPQTPPEYLYHGTVETFLPAIRQEGLQKRQRHHVHLSAEQATARQVGQRRGSPIILMIKAEQMAQAGHRFYLSANGVWLVETVPPEFIQVML